MALSLSRSSLAAALAASSADSLPMESSRSPASSASALVLWALVLCILLKLLYVHTIFSFETVGYLGHKSGGFGQTSAPRYLQLVLLAVNSPIIVAIELYTRK